MAFPTTGVIDDFTRANNADLGTNWTVIDSLPGLQLISNAAAAGSAAICAEFWNVGNFGADSEAYVTIATLPGNAGNVDLFVRLTTETGTADGYGVEFAQESGTDQTYAYRMDNLVATQLGASVGANFSAGDKLGLEAIGTTINVYRFTASAWAQILTRTDATYTTAGKIGILADTTAVRLDDYGGGTVVVASATSKRKALLGVGQ